ncbi:MAG: response regulator [Bacteroidia bacterium]|nr:response regulator [Bacteroidia bacterium]MCF8425388.1 response regulator [Bacteroidia bacterium]MCF8446429.1 response regulator [Bacteroidia bacterium]
MRLIHILLVEDNEGDILLTREALEESKILNELTVLRNGKDAIDFVLKNGKFEGTPLPDLILLDINLPLKNGHEVLQALKNNDSVKDIPIIMLTTSSAERDIQKSYDNHANCYIAKPVEVSEFLDCIIKMGEFWLSIVKLPGKN